jgi:NAD-dependent SIR2 family protein deacetylase
MSNLHGSFNGYLVHCTECGGPVILATVAETEEPDILCSECYSDHLNDLINELDTLEEDHFEATHLRKDE